MEILIAIVTIIGVIATIIGVILTYQSFKKKQASSTVEIKNIDKKNDESPKVELQKPNNPILINKSNIEDDKIINLAILIKSSAILLEEDRLVGSWGKTIGKYMESTQDEDKWSPKDVFKYLLTGSLTHTYHALNGLFNYYKVSNRFFDPLIAKSILDYVKTWRLNTGAFATPVTNFDGSKGNPRIYKESDADVYREEVPQLIRHTSCGILTINRLLKLRECSLNVKISNINLIHKWEEIVEILTDYNIQALQILAAYSGLVEKGDPDIWGKARYTPAYFILAIEEGLQNFQDKISNADIEKLLNAKKYLIEFVFNYALESGERFFCQFSNKKAYYYYSLLLLDNFLNVKDFINDDRSYSFCKKLISALNDIVLSTGGLSFGNPEIPSKQWLSNIDIGVTARYLNVISKYSSEFEDRDTHLINAFNKALNFIANKTFDLEYALRNSMTHGWEAVLNLISIMDSGLKNRIKGIVFSEELENNEKYRKLIKAISMRDFKGRKPKDQQKRFLTFLADDLVFSNILEKYKKENKINMLYDLQRLHNLLETNFKKETFSDFLDAHKIPFKKNASLEDMIDTTLFQFQFKNYI